MVPLAVCAVMFAAQITDALGWLVDKFVNIARSLVQWPPCNLLMLVALVVVAWAIMKVAGIGWKVVKWVLVLGLAALLVHYMGFI